MDRRRHPLPRRLLVLAILLIPAAAGCALYDDVSEPPPVATGEDAELLPKQKTIGVGQEAQLRVVDGNGNEVDPASVGWNSGDPNVAAVDEMGVVTGVGTGTALITAKWRRAELTAAITVDIRIGTVEVTPSTPSIPLGTDEQMQAVVRDQQGEPLDIDVTWTTDDPGIASVDRQSGVVTGQGRGETFIYATTEVGNAEGNTKVTVTEPTETLEVAPNEAVLVVSEEVCLDATPKNSRGEPLADRAVSWSSKDSEVATIATAEEQRGAVTAVGPGSTDIVAESEDVQTTVSVSVSSWADAAAGYRFSCGATDGGRLYCWGRNGNGQLGNGTSDNATHPTPVVLEDLEPRPSFREVEAGFEHACAVTESDDLYCWGSNDLKQLGLGRGSPARSTTPANVSISSPVRDVGVGFLHTCAVGDDGVARCWGANGCGQVGSGVAQGCGQSQISVAAAPVEVAGDHTFADVAAGNRHTCGLTEMGEILCWGKAGDGQLGNGAVQNVQSEDPDGDQVSYKSPQPLDLANANTGEASSGPATPFQDLAAGRFHTCALDANGTVWCWGRNSNRQAGPNCADYTKTNGDYDLCAVPSHVPFPAPPKELFNGADHMCAIAEGGETLCWGRGRGAELGDGNGSNSATPVEVSTGDATYVNLGSGGNHSCATTAGGDLQCWGANIDGQIGNGTSGDGEFVQTPASVTFPEACQ